MKKLLILAVSGLAALSCGENDKYDLEIPMAGIMLSSPANDALVNLNDTAVDSYEFSWDKASEQGNVLIFSASPVLLRPQNVTVPSGTSRSLSAVEADAIFSALGMAGSGTEQTVYWAVKPVGNTAAAASEIRALRAVRLVSRLLSPINQTSIALDWSRPEQKVAFTWDTQGFDPSAGYTVVFSPTSDMDGNPATFPAGATNTLSLTHDQLQEMALGYANHPFKPVSVYWNIRDNESGNYLSRTSMSLSVNPMLRFRDVRGTETITYPVARISYQDGSEEYWLAENLRATKYPDGSDIGADVMFASGGDLTPEQIHIYGGYYTADPAMMGRLASPDWKIPTLDECRKLYNAARASHPEAGLAVICDPEYFDNTWLQGQSYIGEWGLNLVTAGQEQGNSGTITNFGYCYLMAGGIDDDNGRAAMFAPDGLWTPWNSKVTARMLYTK